MTDYCAFSRNNACVKWMDYQAIRHELEEADELCHCNWTEIQRQRKYIDLLTDLLKQHGIDVPPEL